LASSETDKKAVLVLEDGALIKGVGFGATKKVSGEVVFNTGMVGYVEAITDPSYHGQILMQTYPLIGNYGVCPDHFESDGPKIQGYVIHELCREPSHWASKLTLDEWLQRTGVPGIERVDTRMLTKKIRNHGTMLGILQVYEKCDEPDLDELREEAKHVPDPNMRSLAYEVATNHIKRFDVEGESDIVLIDFGVKKSIVKNLTDRNLNVILVPPKTPAKEILDMNPVGIVISSGPGDPKRCEDVFEVIRQIVKAKIPVLGICLGNQILALSLGGDTYKLKFGHRGQNHPCIDVQTGRTYITSQNHGYAVDALSLEDTDLRVTFVNANDNTVEGITHVTVPVSGVQFHPEASSGPNDLNYLFDKFFDSLKR